MRVGDLVFCHGYRGLILKTHHATYYTEHFVYWFNLNDEQPACWLTEKQLLKVS